MWLTARATRTGRLAILDVRGDPAAANGGGDSSAATSAVSRGAFDELSLGGNLYLGGVPAFDAEVSDGVPVRENFRGCVQKVGGLSLNIVGGIQWTLANSTKEVFILTI